MIDPLWIPVAYPLNVKYKGDREYCRVVAIEQIPLMVEEIKPDGGPVCSMTAENNVPVDWYRAEGKFYRTLIDRPEGGRHTISTISQLGDRQQMWHCMNNHTYGPEDGYDQPGGYNNAFNKDVGGALTYEAILAGQHPQWSAANTRPPKDIQAPEKDAAFAEGLKRAKAIRRFGDLVLVEAELPTFALRVMPMLPRIDIQPHVATTTFVGHCVNIPFGIGELDIARRCAATLLENETLRAGYQFDFEDHAAGLVVHDEELLGYANLEHQNFLFLRNSALSLYTSMSWSKFPDVPFEALNGYATARAASDAYLAGDASKIDDAMFALRQAEKSGFDIFDTTVTAIKTASEVRADMEAKYDQDIALHIQSLGR